jgi:hypothetical protein
MRKRYLSLLTTFLTLISLGVTADELTGYVQNCENELGFAASEVPTLNCNDGFGFDVTQTTPINDYVGHAQINANVDLVFACRWLSQLKPAFSDSALGVELIIHNRDTGGTCFFAAKDPANPPDSIDPTVSTTIVSPTAANASSYWMQPREIENKKYKFHGVATPNTRLRCVGCHVAGPYVASYSIAQFLQRFGLLNDGHDTFATRYYAVLPPPTILITGTSLKLSSFWNWNNIIHANNSTVGLAACATGCHSIGTNSTAGTIVDANGQMSPDLISFPVIASLQDNITGLIPVMPPTNPANPLFGGLNYRWVNMNSPMNNHDGEFETLDELRNLYPKFWCSNPKYLTAHVIDSDEPISTNAVPDKLDRFNLQDGLVCLNADQPSGRCQNYQTRYMCNGRFTAFQDLDSPGGSGDWEVRRSFAGLCASPTWIQARYKSDSTWVYVNGPADRLAQFDNKGLVCYNQEQDNGRCSNYVVRFDCN